jgi:hypothetical protein
MLKNILKKQEEIKYKAELKKQLEYLNQKIEETLDNLHMMNRLVIDYDDDTSITIYIEHIKMIAKNHDNTCRIFLSVSDYIDTPYSYNILPEAIALYKKNYDQVDI